MKKFAPQISNPQRLLVIKPSSLGDILHVFPALAQLHQVWPQAELDFLVHPKFAELLDFSPFPVRRKILFEREKLGKIATFGGEFRKLWRELRQEKYDLVIDFQGLLRSAFFASLAHSKYGVAGFADPREHGAVYFYRHSEIKGARMHAVPRNLALANYCLGQPLDSSVEFSLPESSRGVAECRDLPANFVALIPGARWESKAFSPQLFAHIIAELHVLQPGLEFVALGAPSEIPVTETIKLQLPGSVKLHNLAGKSSLPGMIEILRRSRAVISNDSGPLHAAALLKKGIFCFFGPTDPDLTGPWCPDSRVYRRTELNCLNCMKRVCPLQQECHLLPAEKIAADISAYLNHAEQN